MISIRGAGAAALSLWAVIGGAAWAQAPPQPPPPPPPSAAEAAALQRAAHRGDLIYLLDQAAWVSTDAMLKVAPDPHALGVIGWVISPKDDGLQVTYYRQQGDHPAATFVAQVVKGQVVASHAVPAADDIPLTPFERLMIQARTVASREPGIKSCTAARMNAVVLPPDTQGGPWPVYLLSAQVKTGEYPFGGHYEIDVSDDGKVVGRRAFTNSCLNMGQPPTPPSGKPAFVVVTQILDATPTEIHVYLSQWMKLPVVVLSPTTIPPAAGQPHRTWLVDHDHIDLMRVDP